MITFAAIQRATVERLRRGAHFALAMLSIVPWLVAYWAGVVCVVLTRLSDKVWPEADIGNCWSYALPRWTKDRGSLVLTFVEDARFMRIFPVIHCSWMPDGPGRAPLEMTKPVERKPTQWLPWQTFYFRFSLVKIERRKCERRQAPIIEPCSGYATLTLLRWS